VRWIETSEQHSGTTCGLVQLNDGDRVGGLLVSAALNLRPDLWRVAMAEVPIVDALSPILDPSLPLTVTEWEE